MSSAREEARQRGCEFKAQLLESLDWLTPEQAANHLGCPVAELNEKINAGDLIAVEHDDRVLVPACQFAQGGQLLPYLRDALKAMSLESPWIRLSWLIFPCERLGGASPLEALTRDPEAVIWAARGVGVQGGA